MRRIAEHREKLTEKKINAISNSLMKGLKSFVSDAYEKYSSEDGRLYIADLEKHRKMAWFLNEIVANCDEFTPALKKEMTALIDETYKKSYDGMASAVQKVANTDELKEILKDTRVQPDVLRQAVNNNVSKLTLDPVMQKYRGEIIYQLQQELVNGLRNGDRYEQMAKRITERVNISKSKAMNIVRTESHRNVEAGMMDCAENIQKSMEGTEYIYAATWRTMKDERVRPNQRVKTKKGWKTYKGNGANHQKMEGQTVKVGEEFSLGGGVKAKAPGQSGVAGHDCNCRCFLEYNLMTVEEFAKSTNK